MFKSGFISIIGRPNVGKSTLLNFIMGEKLSIVSSKPQTTRNNIQTILTGDDYQFIFVDTPGIHKPRHKLGEYMVKSAKESTKDIDLMLFLTTPEGEIYKADEYILEDFKDLKIPKILVINKVDQCDAAKLAETITAYSSKYHFDEIVPISALKGKYIDKLTDTMKKYIPEGPKYYPEDMITDQNERFIVSEVIREKALRLLQDEVPHGIAIEVITMKKSKNDVYDIDANILCEKETHKGIIIGKGGKMLKKIGTNARLDIEKFLDSKVNLTLWVKVKKEWRDNTFMLGELGYKENRR